MDIHQSQRAPRRAQQGLTLIVVLILLVVVTVLGIGGARIALLSERSTRYDRDHQVAWQAAEAALIDAEYDIAGPVTGGGRVASFRPDNTGLFAAGCGTTAANRGLCRPAAPPIWTTVDFDSVTTSAPTVGFGAMTGFPFETGANGVQPSRAPRYIIEWLYDTRPGVSAVVRPPGTPRPVLYRITSMGFGPNPDVRVMMQSTFAKR